MQIERFNEPRLQRQRLLLIGRLQRLQRLGRRRYAARHWAVHADAEKTLRALGERGDIIRTMQRAMRGEPRELAVFEPGDDGRTILGRVAAKGLADELRDRGYLVIDGVDGKAHYVALNTRDELANYPAGAVVEVKDRPTCARPTGTSPRWRAMACTAPITTGGGTGPGRPRP